MDEGPNVAGAPADQPSDAASKDGEGPNDEEDPPDQPSDIASKDGEPLLPEQIGVSSSEGSIPRSKPTFQMVFFLSQRVNAETEEERNVPRAVTSKSKKQQTSVLSDNNLAHRDYAPIQNVLPWIPG